MSNKQIMVIRLNLHPGALDARDLAILNTTITGYYEARKYYEPQFMNGTDVSYINSTAASVDICAEGITDEGIPVAATIRHQVK